MDTIDSVSKPLTALCDRPGEIAFSILPTTDEESYGARPAMVRKGVGERLPILLGIDVSKDTLACTLLDPQRQLLWEGVVPNGEAGIALLLKKVAQETPWVLEPTGRYGQRVARAAQDAGRQVLLTAPRKAKQFLQSIQSRAKTDRLDSRGLAQFAFACALPAYPLKEAAVDTPDQLLSARKGIAKSIMNLQ